MFRLSNHLPQIAMKSEANDILKFLEFSQKLKSQERTIKLSADRNESVADHSWHLSLMALVVAPKLEQEVDLLKVLKMIIIHDLVEAEFGDIGYGYTATDDKLKAEKEKQERIEIEKIKHLLDDELGEEVYDIWLEFEDRKSNEAKFVKALDSLEANFQSIMYDVSYWDDWFYKIALDKAKEPCQHEKILRELNDEVTIRMKAEIERAGYDLEKL